MDDNRFPIMGLKYGAKFGYVPMDFMQRFAERCRLNHSQTVERLRERGGLDAQEAMAVVQNVAWHNRRWRESNAAWANLQIIVSAEYPDWNFDRVPTDD